MGTLNPYNTVGTFPQVEPGGACLSPSQIRTLTEEPAKLVYYPRASLARAIRELVTKPCHMCGEDFKTEKYRSSYVHLCPTCRGLNSGGIRREITRFSESSRRNLMRRLNTIDRDVRPLFVTLTYPDEFAPHNLEPDRWKRDIKAFEMRFRRQFPNACYIWRLEIVDRKSGEHLGALFPHFHLLTFGVKLSEMRSFVAEHWHAVAGQGSAEHLKVHQHTKTVTPVISRRGIMRYASKSMGAIMSPELGKDVQSETKKIGQRIGRWWGIIARDIFSLFVAQSEELEMSDGDVCTLLRYFRRAIGVTGRSWRSLTIFMDGEFISKNLLKMLGASPGKWSYQSSGRRYDEPFWKFAYRENLWIPELGV